MAATGLRQISQHQVNCRYSYLWVEPNVTYDGNLLSQEFPNNNIGNIAVSYYAVQQRCMGCYVLGGMKDVKQIERAGMKYVEH